MKRRLTTELIRHIEETNFGNGIYVSITKSVKSFIERNAYELSESELNSLISDTFNSFPRNRYNWKIVR